MEDSAGGAKLWQTSAWSFGGLVKSLTSKSEEVLQAYQRDLQEFGIGLKKETASAAEVTAHAVKELPLSLEGTAAVAQESLEAVGQTLEEFGSSVWRGTADLIGQVKEAVKKVDEEATDSSEASVTPVTSGRYSRYDAQLNALQCDSSTYCDEPEDQEDYTTWKSTFDFDARNDVVDAIMEENAFVQELHARIVPTIIDHQTFWMRYFYRLNKLQQAEDARADLVKRANAMEEDLSWEVDEDNEGDPKVQHLSDQANVSSPIEPEEAIPEDEDKSDNSTSSDWLVVQEDRDTSEASQPSAESRRPSIKDDQGRDEQKMEKRKNAEEGATDEDWGEWE